MNSMGPNYPENIFWVSFPGLEQSQQVFCEEPIIRKKELAFIATLTIASEIGNDGAAGDSGVPHSINISSDSPSAISDSFG